MKIQEFFVMYNRDITINFNTLLRLKTPILSSQRLLSVSLEVQTAN